MSFIWLVVLLVVIVEVIKLIQRDVIVRKSLHTYISINLSYLHIELYIITTV